MKFLKITIALVFVNFLFNSCVIEDYKEELESAIFVEAYDLWYVDYHATQGQDQIPYMQLAFTLSFDNGKMYANNNISGIGFQGDGYGIQVGDYSLYRDQLVSNHDLDGIQYFEIKQISDNEIEMYHAASHTSYFLIGYDIDEFDYDKLFYENIEYLLQDYEIWNKFSTSIQGTRNEFDNENFLSFGAENNNTFYSSNSIVGTDIASVYWNYEGGYEVFDIDGIEDLKILTLSYDSVNEEIFELKVISDNFVELFHISSETVYRFEGHYFIQYLKDGTSKNKNRIERKRTKIKRQKINKSSY